MFTPRFCSPARGKQLQREVAVVIVFLLSGLTLLVIIRLLLLY